MSNGRKAGRRDKRNGKREACIINYWGNQYMKKRKTVHEIVSEAFGELQRLQPTIACMRACEKPKGYSQALQSLGFGFVVGELV